MLCDQVNNDVWGDGYKIVTKYLNITTKRHGLSKETIANIIKELFPERDAGRKEKHPPY